MNSQKQGWGGGSKALPREKEKGPLTERLPETLTRKASRNSRKADKEREKEPKEITGTSQLACLLDL